MDSAVAGDAGKGSERVLALAIGVGSAIIFVQHKMGSVARVHEKRNLICELLITELHCGPQWQDGPGASEEG
jgi:hypothetical protein